MCAHGISGIYSTFFDLMHVMIVYFYVVVLLERRNHLISHFVLSELERLGKTLKTLFRENINFKNT